MTGYELKQRMTKDGRGTDNFDLFLDGKEGNPASYYVTTAIATFHTERLAKKVLEFLNNDEEL